MVPGTSYTGAVDSSGGPITLGTSEDKIRIDAAGGGGEYELTIDEARALMARLAEAVNDAEDWAITHQDDDGDE